MHGQHGAVITTMHQLGAAFFNPIVILPLAYSA